MTWRTEPSVDQHLSEEKHSQRGSRKIQRTWCHWVEAKLRGGLWREEVAQLLIKAVI
jgi:hypothetical protein